MNTLEILSTFESAAKFLGRDPQLLPGVTGLPESDANNIIAGFKLDVLSEAAWKAEGKKLDWNNSSQWKYYPWWDMRNKVASGVGLSFVVYDFGNVSSAVGSRRVFPSSEIVEYLAKQHFELFKAVMIISEIS